MKFFAKLVGFVVLFPSALFADGCDLSAFLKNPTRSEARALVRIGGDCLAPLQAAYGQQTDEKTRLLILKVMVANETLSPEAEIFLKNLAALVPEPGSDPKLDQLIASLPALLKNPTDSALQDAFLTALNETRYPWPAADLAFFGERGLSVLEELITRMESLSTDSVSKLVHLTSTNFPAELEDLLIPQIEELTETVLTQTTQEASDSLDKLTYAIEAIKNRDWKVDYVTELVSDAALSESGRVRENLLYATLISMDSIIPNELEDKIGAFYFNDETGISDENETDEHFYFRRSRLLQFVEVVHSLDRQQKGTRLAIKSWVRDNAEFIALSNMAEFQAGMMGFVRRLEDPEYVVDKLLASKEPKAKIMGLRMMREIPATHWDNVEVLKEKVTGMTQFGFPAVVSEEVRLEAVVTARYLSRDRLDMAPLLSGLSSPSEDVRLSTVRLIRETKDGSTETLRAVIQVLKRDPNPAVRIEALGLVFDQLERAGEAPNAFVYSRPLGITLLLQWRQSHKELLEAASETLERYLAVSPHASSVVVEGIRSNDKAITPKAFAASAEVMRKGASELGKLLSAVRIAETENHRAPFEAFGNLTDLGREIYEVIKANYEPGQLMESDFRATRLIALLENSYDLVKELKEYEADPDPNLRQRVEKSLNQLRTTLDEVEEAPKP